MVTHNIEEAVEMATRICILFPHPGRLGLVLENNLPYPRNPNHPEFQRLMRTIHETITQQALPDLPPDPPPPAGRPISRARGRMESIPTVGVNQILGLLGILHDEPDLNNVYDISNEIGKDFGETITIVKAAEIREFVNTPKDEVEFTELGRRFFQADRATREEIFAEQVQKLRLFLLAYLETQDEVPADTVTHDIATALPYENPGKDFTNDDCLGTLSRADGFQREYRDGNPTGTAGRRGSTGIFFFLSPSSLSTVALLRPLSDKQSTKRFSRQS
jgi:NitT/TauT family transport system ATP-binding protein